jgi:hypothetical protein
MTISPKFFKARRLVLLGCASLALPLCVSVSFAQESKAVMETPMLDPWVPPGTIKKSAVVPQTQGDSLAEQVERKLRMAFDAADTSRKGSLTRAQAEAGGLGYIANNFDAIDRAKTGSVTFEDVKTYLNSRGAKLK